MSAASLRKEVARLREKLGEASAPAAEIDDPVAWAEAASGGLSLDSWQRRVLQSKAKRLMLLCARQVGKSEITALLASSIAARGGAVIVVAPSLRQSSNMFRRMRAHLQKAGARMLRETNTEIALAGGGWATCLPGDRPSMLRGLSLRHAGEAVLCIDEAAYTREDLWPVASPMLAAAPEARLVMLSTPAGPIGEFHRAWTDDAFDAERITVKACDCPRISPQFLDEERRRLGALFRQEYEVEFLASGSSVFSADALASFFAKDVTPIDAIEDDAPAAIDWSELLGEADASTPAEKQPRRALWSF